VQLINQNGENIGVISRDEALKLAAQADLDLVMIAPKGSEGMPVVKIMDFGKALYEKKKKQAEAKKKQKIIQVKELKFRPKIGEHDFLTKMKRGIEFLKSENISKSRLCFGVVRLQPSMSEELSYLSKLKRA